MKEYNHAEIEKKWQKYWRENNSFVVKNSEDGKENAYILIEFPYPSGKGLHVGHVRSYSALDVVARKLRIEGKNVLFPIGVDAFGLEAERTAIKEKLMPQEIVERNVSTFREQLEMVGLSFDWSRFVNTSDPEYFKWTQWQFLKFFEKGLAYKGSITVNWCPECGVLANEEVENGKCCQCHKDVTQKPKSQWLLKMTDYADRLERDLNKTDYLEHIKISQKNWIGKSEGVTVEFKIKQGGSFKIFTTCIETIYGITFMVLAPENPLVNEMKDKITNYDEVIKYVNKTNQKSEFERRELLKEKTGCLLGGLTAINPVNGKEVPIYIGDFVLANYGTGAVMAVPSHDQRDYEFANIYNIDKIEVISGGDTSNKAFEKEDYLGNNCKLINSEEFSGLVVEEAKEKITEKLISMGVAEKTFNYKMRDWVFSRQRYWGEPIPIIHCKHCGMVPVLYEELPLTLPQVSSYEPTHDGESPLSEISEWVNTKCPKCGADAKRETDTMPGWAGSSWYFLRYCDPNNNKEFANFEALKSWLPVSIYNGGNEHTTRHLMYARFWVKALFDMGLVPLDEPFKSRISQGLILGSNGVKMSKSLGNVVDPREVIKDYGADALRLWEMYIGDYFDTVNWNDDGVKSCKNLLNRIWKMQEILVEGDSVSDNLKTILNQTIKKVTADINNIKFNTAIAQLFILVNEVYKVGKINKFEYKNLLTLINPFAPHITEEIWEMQNFGKGVASFGWPKFDENALVANQIEIPVQINGKLKGTILISNGESEENAKNIAFNKFEVIKTANIVKTIYVPNKIINFIVKQ